MFQQFFETESFSKTLVCIIAATLSNEFMQSLKELFINDSFEESASMQMEIKAASWLSRLTLNLKTHIMGINFYQINNTSDIDITISCRKLASEITTLLKENNLFKDTYAAKQHQCAHTVSLYTWIGTNLSYKQLEYPNERCCKKFNMFL